MGKMLDIGSRFGIVMRAAEIYNDSLQNDNEKLQITGIEIDPKMKKIYKRTNICEGSIIIGDILDHLELIEQSNFIIMSNVFEYFVEGSKEIEIWGKIFKKLKSGTILLTVPSMEETAERLVEYCGGVSREDVEKTELKNPEDALCTKKPKLCSNIFEIFS